MANVQLTLTDGNGTALYGAKSGEKGENIILSVRQGKGQVKLLGTFARADLKQFARSL